MKPSLVVIGLGNPGTAYARTRHNVGFLAIDVLSSAFGEGKWRETQKFTAQTQEGRVVAAPILLVKPQTYMNDSGACVRKIIDFYSLTPATQILVVSDDIDLPLGDVRLRLKGGPGTHNGLRSVVSHIGEEFPRLRIGLGTGPRGEDLAAWVLSVPPEEERSILDGVLSGVPDLVRTFVLEEMKE